MICVCGGMGSARRIILSGPDSAFVAKENEAHGPKKRVTNLLSEHQSDEKEKTIDLANQNNIFISTCNKIE